MKIKLMQRSSLVNGKDMKDRSFAELHPTTSIFMFMLEENSISLFLVLGTPSFLHTKEKLNIKIKHWLTLFHAVSWTNPIKKNKLFTALFLKKELNLCLLEDLLWTNPSNNMGLLLWTPKNKFTKLLKIIKVGQMGFREQHNGSQKSKICGMEKNLTNSEWSKCQLFYEYVDKSDESFNFQWFLM